MIGPESFLVRPRSKTIKSRSRSSSRSRSASRSASRSRSSAHSRSSSRSGPTRRKSGVAYSKKNASSIRKLNKSKSPRKSPIRRKSGVSLSQDDAKRVKTKMTKRPATMKGGSRRSVLRTSRNSLAQRAQVDHPIVQLDKANVVERGGYELRKTPSRGVQTTARVVQPKAKSARSPRASKGKRSTKGKKMRK
ncbi:hypothetical protein PMAYCL1PPCAC_17843 [Pristionchus mayeri]|uniref:Uncharacterized protein n=1 Tax=Pristionchus mayeri TaxID=1317129 RepID=A0AAN5CNF8_9BILA|nr:hypothetical protein PMAYCL1PPCAC_17843 [Pristionchus mayeri]